MSLKVWNLVGGANTCGSSWGRGAPCLSFITGALQVLNPKQEYPGRLSSSFSFSPDRKFFRSTGCHHENADFTRKPEIFRSKCRREGAPGSNGGCLPRRCPPRVDWSRDFPKHCHHVVPVRASSSGSTRSGSKAKPRLQFVCENCGETFSQWWGTCQNCKQINTLKEFREATISAGPRGGAAARAMERIDLVQKQGKILSGDGAKSRRRGAWLKEDTAGPQRLADVNKGFSQQHWRLSLPGNSGSEVSRVLGGGVVPGSLILVGGDPGVGKSTLLLQGLVTRILCMISEMKCADDDNRLESNLDDDTKINELLSEGLVTRILCMISEMKCADDDNRLESNLDDDTKINELLSEIAGLLASRSDEEDPAPVLYVSGEESVEQISNRADRMQIEAHDLFLYSATDLEVVLDAIRELEPKAVIIDSIQTVYLPEATGSAGSVIQVRECAAAMLRLAKRTSTPIFLVGHVTKTGDIAGPRVLEHIVDVVLYMEGERLQSHRLLRVVKNRYGSSDEVGVFEMVESGLQVISNPSALFLSERAADSNVTAAAAVAVTMEGTRPLLLEVQALCSSSGNQQAGRRTANGVDHQRLHLLLAVLTKQAGFKLQNQDVFINVVGGFQLREPAADVAVAIAICSSLLERPVPRDMAFVGEVGLGGEIRSVGQLDRRIAEAAKLGFRSCIVPQSATLSTKGMGSIAAIPCANLKEVVNRALGPP